MEHSKVEEAIALLGGPSSAARAISSHLEGREKPLTPTAVSHWAVRGIPGEYCLLIERILEGKIKRHELRPDLYPPEEYGRLTGAA